MRTVLAVVVFSVCPLRANELPDVDKLVGQLGSPVFAEREVAEKALESIGDPALSVLRRAAVEGKTAEVRRRAAQLMELLVTSQHRQVRSVRADAKTVRAVTFSPD